MITVNDVIAEVRKLAAEKPDNTYTRPGGKQCCYDAGVCTDGSVGCIFGQALARLGHPASGTYTINSILFNREQLGLARDRPAGLWCSYVQDWQDEGFTWARAVEYADAGKIFSVAALNQKETVSCPPSET